MESETQNPTSKPGEGCFQTELDLALIQCAAKGTYAEAKRLLDSGARVNVIAYSHNPKERGTRTALGNATYRGHYQLVRLLLDCGANPNIWDDLTTTPLVESMATDNAHMAQLLLEGGADPNADMGWDVQSAMHIAMTGRCSSPEIIRLLLKHEGDPNLEHHGICMPLHSMAQHGGGQAEYEKLKVLLEEGENVCIAPKDENGHSPLEVAIREGNRPTLETMLRFDLFRELDNHRWLHVAVGAGNLSMMKYLVKQRDYDINALCRGATPLQVAVDENSSLIFKWLKKHGGQIAPAHSKSKCACQAIYDSDC